MSDTTRKSNRRDALKTIGGVLGGVSLLGQGPARGQSLASLPNGYKFYRVLRANQDLPSFGGVTNQLGDITGSVMMATPQSRTGIGYVYIHGTLRTPDAPAAVFEVALNFSQTPPAVQSVRTIAVEGLTLNVDNTIIAPGRIGTGACNSQGQYVTTIEPIEGTNSVELYNSPGVYLYRAHGNGTGAWSRVIRFGDPVPEQDSFYGGDFGDVALDNEENLLLAAATTQSPSGSVSGFAGSQALIATTLSSTRRGGVLLQTGQMLPLGSAVVESVGLVDLAARNAFAAQITARNLGPGITRSGTAVIVGNIQVQGQQALVAASPELIPAKMAQDRNIPLGEIYFGPRVDQMQDVAFVTHDGTFQPTVGSNAIEKLAYYSRGSARIIESTQISGASNSLASLGAPCIGSTGLMYGTEMMGSGKTHIYVSNGVNSQIVLHEGQRIGGRAPTDDLMVTEILFGQHPTQVDAFGNLVFAAEFQIDPRREPVEGNVMTALVVGIPQ